MEEGSKIFRGYRALGYVSNQVPLVVRYIRRRRENLIVTCVGKVFHTYGGSKLRLLTVSKIHPEDITALTADSFMVFAAAGKDIYAWRRGSELKHIYRGHAHTVHQLLPFGPHLISVDKCSILKIWDIKSEDQVTELEFPNDSFAITAIAHPATYINKILLGSRQGSLQLWNIKSCKRIYRFKGWKSPVLCLEQAPAVDVMAIGLESGDIIVHNLKYDETIVKFSQDWGSVTGLAFRTDGNPILISGSNLGHVALWDLEKRSLSSQMKDAHVDSPIFGLKCFQGEPILVTSSSDNSLKEWIFDMPDGNGRLLRIKEGHSEPPTRIRFYGSSGTTILSSSQDSTLRTFSTVAELMDKSLGVASYSRKLAKKHKRIENPVKMEPIIDFTIETTREKEWDNIACVHRSTCVVSTWSFDKSKMNDNKLRHQRFKEELKLKDAIAVSICLSICGNFVFIGYSSGHLDKYNIQSGLFRGGVRAHKGTIRGVRTDSLNKTVVTADENGIIKFWSFGDLKLITKTRIYNETNDKLHVVLMDIHRDSGILVFALDDFSVIAMDVVTKEIIRRFDGLHDNQITDMTFSSDARWLITSSLDGSVKVLDLPTGSILDHFATPSPVTSLTVSPKGDYLATTHVDDLGIYLWSNLTLYSRVNLKPLSVDHEPKIISLPSTGEIMKDGPQEETEVEDMEVVEDEDEFVSPSQINEDLITLANLPNSRWQNLLSLDVIKQRNKPVIAPEKPVEAPFFLPTTAGLTTTFDFSKSQVVVNDEENEARKQVLTDYTEFGKRLMTLNEPSQLAEQIESLKEKGPAAIEVEIVSLSPEGGGSLELMSKFLLMLKAALETNRNFETIQAYLGLFMKVHGDTLAENDELCRILEEILSIHETKWKELRTLLESSCVLTSFYKSSLLLT